jgi:hypothetical protein
MKRWRAACGSFRANDWVGDIARGRNTITVMVRQPEVKHVVEIDEFEKWLNEPSVRSPPAEMSRKSRARKILGIKD